MVNPNDAGQEAETSASEKVVINGQEYDVTEASDLIGLGQKTREMEGKWNTSVDKVWPAYGESQTKLKQLEGELNTARQQLSEFQTKKEAGTETPADVREARLAAKKLGIILDEDLTQAGYIKKEELDTYLTQREQEKEQVSTVLSTADKLAKELDGSDGRPKFKQKAVISYANAYNIPGATFEETLRNAYEDMNKEELDTWKAGQINARKPSGLKTLTGTSTGKEPKPVKIDDSNFQDALKESLWGNKE